LYNATGLPFLPLLGWFSLIPPSRRRISLFNLCDTPSNHFCGGACDSNQEFSTSPLHPFPLHRYLVFSAIRTVPVFSTSPPFFWHRYCYFLPTSRPLLSPHCGTAPDPISGWNTDSGFGSLGALERSSHRPLRFSKHMTRCKPIVPGVFLRLHRLCPNSRRMFFFIAKPPLPFPSSLPVV